jgi:hypothetical protein
MEKIVPIKWQPSSPVSPNHSTTRMPAAESRGRFRVLTAMVVGQLFLTGGLGSAVPKRFLSILRLQTSDQWA